MISNKKVWFIFIIFFVLSFPFINFSFEYKKSAKEAENLPLIVKDFLENQVSPRQLYSEQPYLWNSKLLYSVVFYGEDASITKKKKQIDLFLKELSIVTRLNLKEVEASNANVKFLFSKDWRQYVINNPSEFKDSRAHTKKMNNKEYQEYWMNYTQGHYAFREVDYDLKELGATTLLFNYGIDHESCQISVNTARTLMLPPHQMKSYTNTCREDKLPLLEEAFLDVYYSKKYKNFLKDRFSSDPKKTVIFFMDEMIAYINQKNRG